jgi:hypothetical protein
LVVKTLQFAQGQRAAPASYPGGLINSVVNDTKSLGYLPDRGIRMLGEKPSCSMSDAPWMANTVRVVKTHEGDADAEHLGDLSILNLWMFGGEDASGLSAKS